MGDFRDVDLSRAVLWGTAFRSSELEEIGVAVGDSDGPLEDPAQVMVLARLMECGSVKAALRLAASRPLLLCEWHRGRTS